MTARVLLLTKTSTYRAEAYLDAARRLGFAVVTGTDEPNYLAAMDPDHNITVPFDQIEKAVAAARSVHEREPLSGVVSTDAGGVVAAAAIGSALRLTHNDPAAARATLSKASMRRLFAASPKLLNPPFAIVAGARDIERVKKAVPFPCVVKPTFLSGSRGVIRANDDAELAAALERAERIMNEPEPGGSTCAGPAFERPGEGLLPPTDERIIVEGFIPGREYVVEGLLVQGTLRELAIFDKPDPLDGPYFEETIYVTPSRTDAATQNALRACAQEATRAIGLTEGPVHVEMRFNDEGAFIIELAARTMGGLCPRIIRFAGDHSLEEVVLRHACGMELPDLTPQPGASGVMMLPIPKRGVLREVRGVEKALAVDGIEDVSISVRAGQEVVPLPEGSRYLGFIFAHAETPAAAETALRKAHALLEFEIE